MQIKVVLASFLLAFPLISVAGESSSFRIWIDPQSLSYSYGRIEEVIYPLNPEQAKNIFGVRWIRSWKSDTIPALNTLFEKMSGSGIRSTVGRSSNVAIGLCTRFKNPT